MHICTSALYAVLFTCTSPVSVPCPAPCACTWALTLPYTCTCACTCALYACRPSVPGNSTRCVCIVHICTSALYAVLFTCTSPVSVPCPAPCACTWALTLPYTCTCACTCALYACRPSVPGNLPVSTTPCFRQAQWPLCRRCGRAASGSRHPGVCASS